MALQRAAQLLYIENIDVISCQDIGKVSALRFDYSPSNQAVHVYVNNLWHPYSRTLRLPQSMYHSHACFTEPTHCLLGAWLPTVETA